MLFLLSQFFCWGGGIYQWNLVSLVRIVNWQNIINIPESQIENKHFFFCNSLFVPHRSKGNDQQGENILIWKKASFQAFLSIQNIRTKDLPNSTCISTWFFYKTCSRPCNCWAWICSNGNSAEPDSAYLTLGNNHTFKQNS
jgi:hypothetical protein